jgi:hypothetical protein
VRGGRLPQQLGHALLVAGEAQAAAPLPAGRLARLRLQPLIDLDAVRQQLGDIGGGAELTDQPSGMKGRTAGELRALQQDNVAPTQARQMIGRAAADDATADDDGASVGQKSGHALPCKAT